jgi:hypothetical protein
MGGGKGGGGFSGTQGSGGVKFPNVQYPGDNPSISPGPGFVWEGNSAPEFRLGNWYNRSTDEKWYYDPNHPIHGTHWDYTDPDGNRFRVYPDNRIELKTSRKDKKKW